MALNIVLIEPEIPNNTGNIGRLALATGSRLHLVKPFGFEIDDKRLKRAGLDYWQHLEVIYYDNVDTFFKINHNKNMAFLSSHGTKHHWAIDFEDDMFLVFGKESVGLSKEITEKHADQLFKIPMYSDNIRSLNLANAVSIIVYEGLRQLNH
ncbi:tRNA (cytidine(34)-2'-O)-methyltransferase [Winogradskyella litorisediminis]|uniref:Putative tRNA (cytidine(34)-2'-O)-methyltransferase n=1 Tax=Winogradskyella litorisediminis TaxID=1156618 RepID=A0ABW3N728_9FLAO